MAQTEHSRYGGEAENKGQDILLLPDFKFDKVRLTQEGKKGGVGLVLLRDNGAGREILLGRHKSNRNLNGKDGKWGWFGETLEDFEEGSLEVLERLAREEINVNLADLGLYGGPWEPYKWVDLDYHHNTYEVLMHVAWTDQDPSGLVGNSSEITEREWFPLSDFLENDPQVPVREFTIPKLQELRSHLYYPQTGAYRDIKAPSHS